MDTDGISLIWNIFMVLPIFELDISDEQTVKILCGKMRISPKLYNEILKTALKRGLFDKNYYEKTGKLTSAGVQKRAEVVVRKRIEQQQKYEKKNSNYYSVSESEIREEMVPEIVQSKVKKSREEKSREEKSKYKIVKENNTEEGQVNSLLDQYPEEFAKDESLTSRKAKSYNIHPANYIFKSYYDRKATSYEAAILTKYWGTYNWDEIRYAVQQTRENKGNDEFPIKYFRVVIEDRTNWGKKVKQSQSANIRQQDQIVVKGTDGITYINGVAQY